MCGYSEVSNKRTVFNKGLKSAQAVDFFHYFGPRPRDSKKSKFSHLETYLVVLEQLTGL